MITGFLQRIRGVIGSAIIWAVLWIPVGFVFGLYRFGNLGRGDVLGGLVPFLAYSMMVFGIWGAITGAIFGLALLAFERGRSIGELSRRRVFLWGALASVAFPGVLVLPTLTDGLVLASLLDVAVPLSIAAILGGGSAIATLHTARREARALPTNDSSRGSLTRA
jgi:hypothetical protein